MYKNDRRMFERFAVDFSAEIKQPGAQENNDAQCCDISAGGVSLLLEEKLIFSTTLELWLGIPDGKAPFHNLARVVWTKQVQENKWHSGLEFARIDFMDLRRIFVKADKKA